MTVTPNGLHPAPAKADHAGSTRSPACSLRRVVLLNVKYSPNLGDGLLSECLERELAQSLPGCDVTSLDLAGRGRYPQSHGRGRGTALALLDRCPPALRLHLAKAMLALLVTIRLRKHYRNGLSDADAVVVGGGNLFTDADLNFPTKIAAALGQAAKRKLAVAVHGVGVSRHWSQPGTRLFVKALSRSRLAWASVRDKQSEESWRLHFAGHLVRPAEVVIDPGVLASLHYPRAAHDGQGRRIGFCVTDPLAVRYHSDRASAACLDTWYPAALRALVKQGYEVALFTNGSPEDRDYLNAHFNKWIRHARGPVTLARSFETPKDLATFVSGCAAIVAHRMHACIAAYSYGVPAVGLRWDIKLDAFFDLAGRGAHMLDPGAADPALVGQRVAAAIAHRLDPQPLIARARQDVAHLAAQLQRSHVLEGVA